MDRLRVAARDEWSRHGDAATDGLIPRAVQYMFHTISQQAAAGGVKFDVRCSFCEIYNEKVRVPLFCCWCSRA